MTFISRSLTAFAAGTLTLFAATANAQTYPTKPIRLVIPFAPGGGTDVLARMIAAKLTEAMGQSVVIDNRPGSDGVLASEVVARANPDGYTLFIVSSSHAINPALGRKLPYDTMKDFSYITQTAVQQVMLFVHPSVPAKSVKELIALVKAKPNGYNYGSSSNAAALPMELFKSMSGAQIQHIPYKGSGPMLNDLLGGQIHMSMGGAVSVIPHLKAGKLRGLAVGDSKRIAAMPDMPTIAEAGVPGYQATIWTGMLAPAKTSEAIIERVNRDVVKIVRDKEFTARLQQLGSDTAGTTPREWRQFVEAEVTKWSKIAKAANMTAE
ncbi:MAG: tripartite tricarboxylate transporter substrate binding protein [Nitrospira sp.]|nr:tripartite tricarboxylate transporter substrate binding protein [Nitrospira sp.]